MKKCFQSSLSFRSISIFALMIFFTSIAIARDDLRVESEKNTIETFMKDWVPKGESCRITFINMLIGTQVDIPNSRAITNKKRRILNSTSTACQSLASKSEMAENYCAVASNHERCMFKVMGITPENDWRFLSCCSSILKDN